MPQLGESVTEGTINKWLIEVGDRVEKYDPLAEVLTDKVTAEVPSSYTGTITELVAAEGDTIEVGARLCTIEVEEATTVDPQEQMEDENQRDHREQEDGRTDQAMKRRYSPAVLRLAHEYGIDLEDIDGSGRGGRITRKDVQQVIASGKSRGGEDHEEPSSFAPQISQPQRATEADRPHAADEDVEIPVSGVRRAIAANMVKSKHDAPHAWTMVEVDVTGLVQFRNRMKDEFKQKEGCPLTFLPFFIKAAVDAIKEFPRMNAMWAGDKIIEKKQINISVAVATDEALYVPVIHNADEKSIKGLAKNIHDLSRKVRSGRLSTADTEGGTFTVNNTGSFGSVMSAPIINHPQAAILSVESIVKRPVVIDDMIGIRDMVNLCLSLDHRVLDGLICGRFLASVKEKLENMHEGNVSVY